MIEHFNSPVIVVKSMQVHDIIQQNILLSSDKSCAGKPCDQHLTAENILDNFCQADFGKIGKYFNLPDDQVNQLAQA